MNSTVAQVYLCCQTFKLWYKHTTWHQYSYWAFLQV